MLPEPIHVDVNQCLYVKVDSPSGGITTPAPLVFQTGMGSEFYEIDSNGMILKSSSLYILGIDFGGYV